ncbi:MAG: V-type ATP synthase subunit F [Synergistales bacterium]|nr:V-type ATP synthase subunit F [Synergistales bacterium]
MVAAGDRDSVLPFQAVGVEPHVLDEGEALESLRRLAAECAVIFLDENWFIELREEVNELNQTYPVSIIPLPNQKSATGIGSEMIRTSVEKAVGMDIFASGS